MMRIVNGLWRLIRDPSSRVVWDDVNDIPDPDEVVDIASTDKGLETAYGVFLTQFQNTRGEADKAMIAACSAGIGFLLFHLSNPERKIGLWNMLLGFSSVIVFVGAIITLIIGFKKTSNYLDSNIEFMRFGQPSVAQKIDDQYEGLKKIDKRGWRLVAFATMLAIVHFVIFRWESYYVQADASAASTEFGRNTDWSWCSPSGSWTEESVTIIKRSKVERPESEASKIIDNRSSP